MPISDWHHLTDTTNEIIRIAPRSVLDLGIGFGLYGAVCREYTDALHGRCRPDQWEASIVGIEAHELYRNPCWGLYNTVLVTPFDKLDTNEAPLAGNDLVLMIDSLEHLEPEAGRLFLDGLVASNRHVIVSVPHGLMEQGAAHGNEFERHRTTFNGSEFARYDHRIIHQSICMVVSIKGKL